LQPGKQRFGHLTESGGNQRVIAPTRPLAHDCHGSFDSADAVIDLRVMSNEENPRCETYLLTFEFSWASPAIPMFMTLAEGVANLIAVIQHFAKLQCHITTDDL
jgi:hypothetical protein